ncbi:MAG: hypothetical protein HZA36_01010 [Parcubacteria group bacterium]|nr:hypothetical protein [Parcubacteria group bacterium]
MNELDIISRINALLTDLENLGEDKDELEYWRSILEYMEPEQHEELRASLEKEKLELLRVGGKELTEEEKDILKKDSVLLSTIKQQDEAREKQEEQLYKEKEIQNIRNAIMGSE